MSDRHLDGNGVAGLLGEVLAAEPTTVRRRCQGCGDDQPLAAHRAYVGAGVVLRCPSCGAVAAQVAILDDRVAVTWHGAYRMRRA